MRASLERVGLGTAALGFLYKEMSDETAYATVLAAHVAGIRYFDTAHLYGGGLAEKRLGNALEALSRPTIRIATKIGSYRPFGQPATPPGSSVRRAADVWDFSYDRTCAAVETSLQRLRTDRLDVVHVHGFERDREAALKGAFQALRRFQSEGVIGQVGGSSDVTEAIRWAIERDLVDTFITAGRYTLIDRAASTLLRFAGARRIEAVIGGVFNSGILATGAVEGARFDYDPATPEIIERVRRVEALCGRFRVPLKAAALQFPLRNANVGIALLGSANEEELQDGIDLLSAPIDEMLWTALDATLGVTAEAEAQT